MRYSSIQAPLSQMFTGSSCHCVQYTLHLRYLASGYFMGMGVQICAEEAEGTYEPCSLFITKESIF